MPALESSRSSMPCRRLVPTNIFSMCWWKCYSRKCALNSERRWTTSEQTHAHTHTHTYALNINRVFGSFRPFRSRPIINCQARQGDGLLVQPQTESCCRSELRHTLILLVELCCEMMKSWADTRLKGADVWLCCGADWNLSVWTGRQSDIFLFGQLSN